ncbi:unnamed protein product [Phytomonas sp. EM1]|nr:unnamed protein product [Phytomonas sp. EM1]|eukprot:CCW65347.1 unnamed protein product [Phytomonas sp. isolate EM1]
MQYVMPCHRRLKFYFFFLILSWSIFCSSLVSGEDVSDEITINGATFFWDRILSKNELKLLIHKGILKSMQEAVDDPNITIEIKNLNTSGPRLRISYISNDVTKTKPDAFITKPVTHINLMIEEILKRADLDIYTATVPKKYFFGKVLGPRPNHTETFNTTEANFDMFMSGRYEDWVNILTKASKELSIAVRDSVMVTLRRLNGDVEVKGIHFFPEHRRLVVDKKGVTAGMRVRFHTIQTAHRKNLHLYDAFEAGSVLGVLNSSKIEMIYRKYASPEEAKANIYVIAVRDVPLKDMNIFQEYHLLFYALALDIALIIIIGLITTLCMCLMTRKSRKNKTSRA